MINLIREEILNLFPQGKDIIHDSYTMHCSPVFLRNFIKAFVKDGWVIPVESLGLDVIMAEPPNNEEHRHIKFQLPSLGVIYTKVDMEQGYKIEKLD